MLILQSQIYFDGKNFTGVTHNVFVFSTYDFPMINRTYNSYPNLNSLKLQISRSIAFYLNNGLYLNVSLKDDRR